VKLQLTPANLACGFGVSPLRAEPWRKTTTEDACGGAAGALHAPE